MGLIKTCLFLFAVSSILLSNAVSGEDEGILIPVGDGTVDNRCSYYARCDEAERAATMKKGEGLCGRYDNGNGRLHGHDKCGAECEKEKGFALAENQDECFCDLCKRGRSDSEFCEPGQPRIRMEKCDELFCFKGDSQVKYRENQCGK